MKPAVDDAVADGGERGGAAPTTASASRWSFAATSRSVGEPSATPCRNTLPGLPIRSIWPPASARSLAMSSSWYLTEELPQLTTSRTGRAGRAACVTCSIQSASPTSSGFTFQMFSQYSRMARSDENPPIRATLRIDLRSQSAASSQQRLTASWHSR